VQYIRYLPLKINPLSQSELVHYITLHYFMLPAFNFQVLQWTGDSGSNPERAHEDTFLLAANDLTRIITGGVTAVKAFKSLSLGRTSINCQVDRSFAARCSE
jgi:hypothetical protein